LKIITYYIKVKDYYDENLIKYYYKNTYCFLSLNIIDSLLSIAQGLILVLVVQFFPNIECEYSYLKSFVNIYNDFGLT